MHYDLIGDVHGHADKLEALLRRLGYAQRAGAWRKAGHTAVFVGDLIDRGPGQLRVLRTVRAMVEAGSALAVMGNHEFNAIAWMTPDSAWRGGYLRGRTDRNREQHQAFLDEVQHDPALHDEWIRWFRGLPLWLEVDGLRVVHACWHDPSIRELASRLGPGRTLTPELIVEGHRWNEPACNAIETLLKGLDFELPKGASFRDKSGHRRQHVRVRWWHEGPLTLHAAALGVGDQLGGVPDVALPRHIVPGYRHEQPVFFGHYWMKGRPAPVARKVACLDYSAGAEGPLVGYRWEGEPALRAEAFESSHPDTRH